MRETLHSQLIRHPCYVMARRVAVFLSMEDELCTQQILEDVFRMEKSCFVPRYMHATSHMDMLKLNSLQDLENLPRTSWNIRQPAEDDHDREDALLSGGLDLILMPGLGFDHSGRRLGRGKGFYDTYLERCGLLKTRRPYTIGLAFREQICEEIPVNANDVLIDEVLYDDPQ